MTLKLTSSLQALYDIMLVRVNTTKLMRSLMSRLIDFMGTLDDLANKITEARFATSDENKTPHIRKQSCSLGLHHIW